MDCWNGGINRADPSTAGKQPGLGELGFDLLNECACLAHQIQQGLRSLLRLGSRQAGKHSGWSMYQQAMLQQLQPLPREIHE